MGQEIVYCFKCQTRIVGGDLEKGLAFQIGNNTSCAACAIKVLEELPAREKELLLSKMFKATQQRQQPSSTKSRIVLSEPMSAPASPPSSARPPGLTLGLLVGGVLALFGIFFFALGPRGDERKSAERSTDQAAERPP